MANIKLTDHNWHASGIYDTNQNKSQATINSDVATKMGSAQLETTSQNLSGGVNELKGRADTAEAKVDNLVTVSNTQPSSQYNKVWLPITVGEGTQVPTWTEHQSVVSDVSALNAAINQVVNNLTLANIFDNVYTVSLRGCTGTIIQKPAGKIVGNILTLCGRVRISVASRTDSNCGVDLILPSGRTCVGSVNIQVGISAYTDAPRNGEATALWYDNGGDRIRIGASESFVNVIEGKELILYVPPVYVQLN